MINTQVQTPNNVSTLTAFNNLTEEFINKMIVTFPNENKLKVYLFNFKASKQFYPRAPMEFFMKPLIKVGYPIMTRDSKFFQSDRYVEIAESFSSKTGLINIWNSTTQGIRDSIWEYTQSLYVLGMTTMGYQEQLQTLLKKIKNESENSN